ncbi:MAG: histidinol-phosphate transaminase [Planctomycetales bacterium]|nr:histidinol-phosphate transaminase [Planctomycetales bacterium]
MAKTDLRPALSRMLPYTPGEQPPPGKFIKLNTNENPYPPPPAVVSAIRDAASGPLNRYPDPTATAFRRTAASVLGLPGPEWILAGNGSDEILTILVRGFVGEGQKLRLPYPSYILYRTLADIQGAAWEQVPFLDGWHLPTMFGQGEKDLRLVFLPNPNSPSGTIVPVDEVARLAASLPCPLVVDEAYADFATMNCLGLVQKHDNVLVTRTLSKSYGLAGVRFGFLVAQPSLIAKLTNIKDSYNCDYLATIAATAAMSSQDWLADVVAKMNVTRARMQQQLSKIGFDVTPSHANFVWCTHPSGRHQELHQYLKKNQILVRYMDFPDWGDGLRISVGTDDQIDACMMMIKRFFE